MWRLVFLGLIIYLAVYFFRRYIGKVRGQKSDTDNIKRDQATEDMVQCAHCQVHTPRSEAFLVAGHFYCCQAHIQNK
ncbi:MAG: hypothetical protein EXR38_03540 [Methylotenera sp.]|nr:hypothetical protein [Methylotenera sp.]MSP99559.1 hypothetical protein [Methylotenera sp.]